MKWAAIELRWDGAPPLPRLLRVIRSEILALDRGDLYQPDSCTLLTEADITEQGARFAWYKHGDRMSEIAPLVGYHHPCMVRWAEFGSHDDEPDEDDAWAAIERLPWVKSRELGTPDLHGRIGRHPGGTGRVYGNQRRTEARR